MSSADPPSPIAAPELLPGALLAERYRIVRKLGQGGMGTVYEGEHVAIARRVAIKVVQARHASDPLVEGRFHQEARAATGIGHKNIVDVTDFGRVPDGRPFMVLEYLDGRDWERDIRAEGPQPIAKVAHIMIQVCSALRAAHEKAIVHRDLKPENIFITERDGDPCFVKIVDFGISKMQASAPELAMTKTGITMGTPYFMSPEQLRGARDVDHRTDIYALGVMLFRALTGLHPFDAESYPELVLKIAMEPPPPLASLRPDAPPELCALVERMLAKHPEQRPASCAEVEHVLRGIAGGTRAPAVAWPATVQSAGAAFTSSQGPSTVPAPASRSGMLRWALLGILGLTIALVLALGGTLVYLERDRSPEVSESTPATASERHPTPDTPDPPPSTPETSRTPAANIASLTVGEPMTVEYAAPTGGQEAETSAVRLALPIAREDSYECLAQAHQADGELALLRAGVELVRDSDSGTNLGARITPTLSPGAYEVLVWEYGGEPSSITVTCRVAPRASVIGTIALGVPVTVDVPEGEPPLGQAELTLVITAVGSYRCDAHTDDLDAQMSIAQHGIPLEEDSDSGPGSDARITRELAPGTYQVRVWEWTNEAASIRVSCVPE